MTERNTLVLVLPVSRAGHFGPIASWLNTAGWVAGARHLGYDTLVITPDGLVNEADLRSATPPSIGHEGVRAVGSRLPLWFKTSLKDVRELIRSARFSRELARLGVNGDRVVLVWQRHELFRRAGHRLARRLGCPIVVFTAAPKVWEARRWGVRRGPCERAVEYFGDTRPLRNADLVACVSEEVASAVVELGVEPSRTIVTPSTADTELFCPEVDGTRVRESLGLDDRFVVTWTGSFRSFHGVELLVDAAEQASARVSNLRVMLVGDGPERSRLESEVRERDICDIVSFIDTVPQQELPSYLAASDIAVVTSQPDQAYHYSPLKMWEYLAMGLPVVVPATGLPGRVLRDGVDAVKYFPGRADTLASALVRLADDAALRSAISSAGRELAEEHSWDRQLERVLERLGVQRLRPDQ
jgi:glycosyltransferase involved in cell wall biosynthesis